MTIDIVPAGPTANVGELKTLGFLREHLEKLPDYHLIVTNYYAASGQSTVEIDIVVVNSQGVFLLEIKNWVGRIEGDASHWQQVTTQRRHPSPLSSIDHKARLVHGLLSEKEPNLKRVSVVGFVVLVQGDWKLQLQEQPTRAKRVFPLNKRLIQALTGRDYLHSARCITLTGNHFKAISEQLCVKRIKPAKKIIGNYEIIGELQANDVYEAFEARHISVNHLRVRLKRYHIPVIRAEDDFKESIRKFKQDMEALTRVDRHSAITRAYDFFKDPDTDDTYYLASELIEGKLLREIIDESTLTLAQSARYLLPIVEALAYCHQRGVIHRNLTPFNIYVTSDGQSKLGDFDFARVPDSGGTISKTGQALTQTKYTAPEQLNPRQADYRADIYSLGAVWYDMLFQRPEDEPVRLALIQKGNLPSEARDLLFRLLSSHPRNRPALIPEVKTWFELFAEID